MSQSFKIARVNTGGRLVPGLRVLTLAISLVAMLATSPGAAHAFNAPGNHLRFWASTNGGSASDQVYTLEQARDVARRYDVIVALKTTFRNQADEMRNANPRLKILSYMNGSFARETEGTAFPSDWYLRDASENKVRSAQWGNYLMDVYRQGWRDFSIGRCKEFLRRSGFDGCYLDALGVGNLHSNLTGKPINPRTGNVYSGQQWLGDTSGLARHMNDALSTKLVVSNGLNNGRVYFDSTVKASRLLKASDGGNAEGWLRGEATPIGEFKPESSWKLDVDLLVDAGIKGKSVLAMTKIWIPATISQVNRWRQYSYASFLQGTNGSQYLYFNPEGPGKPPAAHPLDRVNIGAPVGPYWKTLGVYRRDFTRGVALVNPTGATVTVSLGATYVDVYGQAYSRLTLEPNTGNILIKR